MYVAEEVRRVLHYEKIIFVPAHIPAHKVVEGSISPLQRKEMLNLALSKYPDFLLDLSEIERGGISYSIDTLHELIAKYRIEGRPGLILGDDLMEDFSTWKMADTLAEQADLIVVHRLHEKERPFRYRHRYIGNIVLPISSSSLRKRIGEGGSVRFIVPDGVIAYIEDKRLYRQSRLR
jgi:nicotinate-nucleotide adenylyltransferase